MFLARLWRSCAFPVITGLMSLNFQKCQHLPWRIYHLTVTSSLEDIIEPKKNISSLGGEIASLLFCPSHLRGNELRLKCPLTDSSLPCYLANTLKAFEEKTFSSTLLSCWRLNFVSLNHLTHSYLLFEKIGQNTKDTLDYEMRSPHVGQVPGLAYPAIPCHQSTPIWFFSLSHLPAKE